jgi:hypothetical protein
LHQGNKPRPTFTSVELRNRNIIALAHAGPLTESSLPDTSALSPSIVTRRRFEAPPKIALADGALPDL